jgi:predicted membrane protein
MILPIIHFTVISLVILLSMYILLKEKTVTYKTYILGTILYSTLIITNLLLHLPIFVVLWSLLTIWTIYIGIKEYKKHKRRENELLFNAFMEDTTNED